MTRLFYFSDWFSRLCRFLRIKTSDLMVNVFRILTTHVVMTNVLAPLSHHHHPMQNFSLHLIEWLSLSPTATFATADGQIVSNKTMASHTWCSCVTLDLTLCITLVVSQTWRRCRYSFRWRNSQECLVGEFATFSFSTYSSNLGVTGARGFWNDSVTTNVLELLWVLFCRKIYLAQELLWED